MRKLFNEFFYIPKHGKIREKAMLARVAMTIAIMVVCLSTMSITAYAYFSHSVTSDSNIIKTANFATDVTVEITDVEGKAVGNSNIIPITSDHKNFRIEGLEVGKWYTIIIEPSDRNTAQTGFVIISAEGCEITYHTQQLGVDKNVEDEYTSEIIFKLMITDATDVIMESHWGTSSCYSDYQIESVDDERYITLDEEIKLIVNGFVDPNISNSVDEGSDENSDSNNLNGIEGISNTLTTETTTLSNEIIKSAEITGTTELTSATESSSSTTEPTTQTTESESTEITTEISEEIQPATEIMETTGAPIIEANE